MRPVLFLDIDGVLNSHDSWDRGWTGASGLDPRAMARLNMLCLDTKARIVVSSTWRGMSRCRDKLRIFGLKVPFHRQWRTRERIEGEWSYESKPRGHQIRDWLLGHPEVTSYAIVDDDSDMLDEQLPRFVKTSHKDGLQDRHCAELRRILSTSL